MKAARLILSPLYALLVLAAITALSVPASAQMPTATVKRGSSAPYPRGLGRARMLPSAPVTHFRIARARIQSSESEPNDSVARANLVVLGDTASGNIDPAGDVDFYALDLSAGTSIALDVQATRAGSPLDPILALFDVDSVTVLAFNDDFNSLDSHIELTVASTGRYFIGIAGYAGSGGAGYFYNLSFEPGPPPPSPGPGDTTSLFAASFGIPWGLAAGAAGEVYVADETGRIVVIRPNDTVTTLVRMGVPIDLVVDGLGNLLVVGSDSIAPVGVIRISATGQKSVFARYDSSGLATSAITVGPNGDVWVGINSPFPQIRQYDPVGNQKSMIDLSAVSTVADLAFSPSGELYFSNGYDAVYKVVGNGAQPVIQGPPYLEGLAFDQDGYLYVANGFLGQVLLYDPAGIPVHTPFARTNLGGPINLAFLRDPSGGMTARLIAANVGYQLQPPYAGGIVEMNPAGMRASGWRVGVDLLRVANASLRAGVVGAAYADTVRLVAPPGATTWSIESGAAPPGITLAASTGVLSGIPEQEGVFALTVKAVSGQSFGFASFAITVTDPTVALGDAAAQLLGGAPLDSTQLRFLDLQGNHNGRFDVGDFRAYLRAKGQLPALRALDRKERP